MTATIFFAVRNGYVYMLWMCVSIWLEGGHFTLFPTVCGKMFGIHGPAVYSIGFITFGVSSLSGIFVVKVLLGEVIGYFGVFMICLALEICALVITWMWFDETPLKPRMRTIAPYTRNSKETDD